MIRVARYENHSFIASELSAHSVVVDLGVNRGAFASQISASIGCRVAGAEPEPELYAAQPRLPRVSVERVAVTGCDGRATLYLDPFLCATVVPDLADRGPDVEVRATTLESFLRRHDALGADLVKMDIEGAELDALTEASDELLRSIGQISVEFHDFLDPEMRPRVEAVAQRLEQLGFRQIRFSRDNTDVLFVNRGRIDLRPALRGYLAVRYKYLPGLLRILRRRLRMPRGR